MACHVFVAHPYSPPPISGYRGVFEELAGNYDDVEFMFADKWLHESDLLNNLVGWIKLSDLVICDLTGMNLNVLIEFGIARGLKPSKLVVIGRGGYVGDLPSDLQGVHYHTYENKSGLYNLIEGAVDKKLDYE